MKKALIATAVLALASTTSAYAQAVNVQGDSSNPSNVTPGVSNFPPFAAPLGYSGLQMAKPGGGTSGFIDIFGGPVTQATNSAIADDPGPYFAPFPLNPAINIAQVWRTTSANNGSNGVINTYVLRQLQPAPVPVPQFPEFGGLVVGQVAGTTKGNGVYFGEWSQAISSPDQGDSTNLNMADASRTVWFVGDNAVSNMDALVDSNNQFQAAYNVVGIRQTGEGTNLPHAPNLYTGVLTADYVTGRIGNPLSGSLARTGDPTVTISADIQSDGRFVGADNNGRFYNDAAALAGIYTGGGASDHIAFGGSRQ